jgi:diguanylate cyclase (GGDEF)-like protein
MTDDLLATLAELEQAEPAGDPDVLAELAIVRARVALAEGRYADVVGHCRTALEEDLGPGAHALLAAIGAEAATQRHDTATAFELAAAALAASHEGPPDRRVAAAVAAHLGTVYRSIGAFRAAAASFERARQLDPGGGHRVPSTARLFECVVQLAAEAAGAERDELLQQGADLLAELRAAAPDGLDLDGCDAALAEAAGGAGATRREADGDLAGALADEQVLLRQNRQRTLAEADHLLEQTVLRANLRVGRRQAEAAEDELRAAALVDPLTHLLNRRGLDAALATSPFQGSVLMVDIDHFKQINDQYGHAAGDDVLERMGRLLADVLREGDLLCRYGGEEFLAVLPRTSLAEAAFVGQRLRAAAAGHAWDVVVDGLDVVTVSVGVAAYTGHSVRSAVREADRALYQAKRAGRNRVIVSDART